MMKQLKEITFLILIASLTLGCNTENKDWEEAKSTNTIEILEEFVVKYPNSEFVIQADSMIEYKHYQEAVASESISDFRKFLNQYPDGIFTSEALKQLSVLFSKLWAEAIKVNTIDGYKYFLSLDPDKPYASLAETKIQIFESISSNHITNMKIYLATVKAYYSDSKIIVLEFDKKAETPGMSVKDWMIQGQVPAFGPDEIQKGTVVNAYTGINSKTNEWEVFFLETLDR